jgi:hypothetical protein
MQDSDSLDKSRQSDTDETVQSAERFVTDIESKMSSRVKKAREAARKAEHEAKKNESEEVSNKDVFWSPPVIGAKEYVEHSYGEDTITLELVSELPNGNKYIEVPAPSENKITDRSHKLNRLLSFYDIEPDKISDLSGHRLPIETKGYKQYNSTERNLVIDYPPIQTIPNRIKYSTKRVLKRLGIIRWGHTPRLEETCYSMDPDKYHIEGTYRAPKISQAAFTHTKMFQENDIKTHVMTEKGVASLFIGSLLLTLGAFIATVKTLSPTAVFFVGLLGVCLTIMNIAFHQHALTFWTKKGVKKIKKRFFPK